MQWTRSLMKRVNLKGNENIVFKSIYIYQFLHKVRPGHLIRAFWVVYRPRKKNIAENWKGNSHILPIDPVRSRRRYHRQVQLRWFDHLQRMGQDRFPRNKCEPRYDCLSSPRERKMCVAGLKLHAIESGCELCSSPNTSW